MSVVVDERTQKEKATLTIAVVGRQRVLSGWRRALRATHHRVAWACRPADVLAVAHWARAHHGDLSRLTLVDLSRYRPRGTRLLYIYAVRPGHPALRERSGVEREAK